MEPMRFCQNKFIFALLLLTLFFLRAEADEIEERLSQLSIRERDSLEYFFSTAIQQDHLGHVLFFSNKPASLVGCFISDKYTRFIEGWRVWKEKESLFPHPNFIIHEEIVDFADKDVATLHLYFINKKTLSAHLAKNESSLKKILGKEFSKEEFIKRLEGRKIGSLFQGNQILIGVLLGYGIESSVAYSAEQNVPIGKLTPIFCAQKGKVTTCITNPRMCKINSESQISPVVFMGCSRSKEAQNLQAKYSHELEKIEKIFQEKDLLKLCMRALCEPIPIISVR